MSVDKQMDEWKKGKNLTQKYHKSKYWKKKKNWNLQKLK
jgi:hypothetical protein